MDCKRSGAETYGGLSETFFTNITGRAPAPVAKPAARLATNPMENKSVSVHSSKTGKFILS